MYQILCDNNIIHDTRLEGLQVIGAKCSLEVNKTGSLTFSIPPTHPNYNDVNKHTSVITLLRDDEVVFVGRVLNDEVDFSNIKNVECEGELSYLLDSIQRKKQYNLSGANVIKTYLQDLINIHNSQMNESRKQFVVGNVTVTDDSISLISNYEDTLSIINDKLINTYGGYILTRHSDDVTYIDYVSEYSGICQQTIEFGKNLIDMTRYIKGEDIFTALIPLGATLESDANEKVTIESLPNRTVGNTVKVDDYIYNTVGVERWGWIWKTNSWDDISNASDLYVRASNLLENAINESFTIELTAIDLNLLNVNVDSIKIGNKIHCISLPHNINRLMFVKSMTIDIDNPQNTKIKLALPEGQSFDVGGKTITESKKDSDKKVTDIKNLIDEEYPTYSDMDTKIDDLKDWVDDNYCSKNVSGDIDLTRYALIEDVNSAFNELASALQEV